MYAMHTTLDRIVFLLLLGCLLSKVHSKSTTTLAFAAVNKQSAAAALVDVNNKSDPATIPATSRSSIIKPGCRAQIVGSIAKAERRAKQRELMSGSRRQVCDSCHRPPSLCLCHILPTHRYGTQTHVLILQHPNERRRHTISTVPLLQLVLQNIKVMVGYEFNEPSSLEPIQTILKQQGYNKPLLLFPSEDAVSLDTIRTNLNQQESCTVESASQSSETPAGIKNNNLLILVDGTWSEAKRILKQSPALVEQCQLVTFSTSSNQKSVYDALRREPQPHCQSTLEACAHSLSLLEKDSNDVTACLHTVLQTHVDLHLEKSANEPRSTVQAKMIQSTHEQRRQVIDDHLFQNQEEKKSKAVVAVNDKRSIVHSNGMILRPLQVSDALTIHSWRGSKTNTHVLSLSAIERLISVDNGGMACWGIEKSDILVACILRYEWGALGIWYEGTLKKKNHNDDDDDDVGMALLTHATTILQQHGQKRVAYIHSTHESLFKSLFKAAGWQHDESQRGSGKDVKWIQGD